VECLLLGVLSAASAFCRFENLFSSPLLLCHAGQRLQGKQVLPIRCPIQLSLLHLRPVLVTLPATTRGPEWWRAMFYLTPEVSPPLIAQFCFIRAPLVQNCFLLIRSGKTSHAFVHNRSSVAESSLAPPNTSRAYTHQRLVKLLFVLYTFFRKYRCCLLPSSSSCAPRPEAGEHPP
jgi:hypothetical protein